MAAGGSDSPESDEPQDRTGSGTGHSGVYFVSVEADGVKEVRRVTVVK